MARPPAAAHASQCDRAIITPPMTTAAAMSPRYPMPTSGVGPSVPGRSITWIIARPASATAPTARMITSAPCAGGAASRRANIGVLLLWDRPRGPGAATGQRWCRYQLLTRIVEKVRSGGSGPRGAADRMKGPLAVPARAGRAPGHTLASQGLRSCSERARIKPAAGDNGAWKPARRAPPVARSAVWLERDRAHHGDASAECRDPLAGYPARVEYPAAGDGHAGRAVRRLAGRADIELACQRPLSPLDLQLADGSPSGRDPDQQLRPEADLREDAGIQEGGSGEQPVKHRGPGAQRTRAGDQARCRILDQRRKEHPAGQGQAAPHWPAGDPRGKRRVRARGIDPPAASGHAGLASGSGVDAGRCCRHGRFSLCWPGAPAGRSALAPVSGPPGGAQRPTEPLFY